MQEVIDIAKKINSASNVLLLTHENPDGDAIGSMMALFLALTKKMNKQSRAVCTSPIPQLFSFLPEAGKIKSDFILGDHDLVIILDCGDLRRTGFSDRLKELSHYKKRIVNIDHHPKNDIHKIAKTNYVDYYASSTSELIYRLLKVLEVNIDPDMATSLLCGLYTDTGIFMHPNTSREVFQISAELLSKGARMKLITNNIINGKTVTRLKLWGLALSRIKHHHELGIISSIITLDDISNCGANSEDLAGIVNLMNTIPDTNAVILLSETEPGKIRASLRTRKNHVDVSRLANIFGGGGLKKASGFSIAGSITTNGDGRWNVVLN